MKIRKMRMLAAAMLLALILSVLPTAFAAGSFQAMVISDAMRVYQQTSPYNYLGSLPQGTRVTVNAYKGNAALISYNGRTGLARVSDMIAMAGSTAPQETAAAQAQPVQAASASETATASEAASARAMVTSRATRVYQHATTASRYVNVRAGLAVNLLASSGNVAKVEKNGIVGYTPLSHLAEPSALQATSQSADAQSGVVQYDRVPVMTTEAARVYAKPSTSSQYVTVAKGTQMVLLAVKGNCAMVEKNGITGYIVKSVLTTNLTSTEQPAPAAEQAAPQEAAPQEAVPQEAASQQDVVVADNSGSAGAANNSSDSGVFSGSNEEIVYKFLVKELGYNTAAACGVMANIKYESGYRPTSSSSTGAYYGIVQWGGSRKTRLVSWCNSSGYDYTTLKGQLYYLKYELTTHYPSVHNRLKAVANTDQGAYDAGYDFCYNFEAPSNRASKSDTRGNYAKTTLWNRYRT